MNFDDLNLKADITKLKGIPDLPIKTRSKSGIELHGACPFCKAGTDRFWVNIENRPMTFYCRQCRKGGDAMQYVAYRENLDRKSNAKEIAEILSKEIGESFSLPSFEQISQIIPRPAAGTQRGESLPPDASWQKDAQAAITSAEESLYKPHHKDVLDYLHGRGLSDATLKHYHIGYWSSGDKYAGRKSGELFIPSGILIPTIYKTVWTIKIRLSEKTKHLWNTDDRYRPIKGGTAGALFGADSIYHISDIPAILCEGEMDAMTTHEAVGDIFGVGTFGSSDYSIDPIAWGNIVSWPSFFMICYDNDQPGQTGSAKIKDQLESMGITARIISLPEGYKDISEYQQKTGQLKEWIRQQERETRQMIYNH